MSESTISGLVRPRKESNPLDTFDWKNQRLIRSAEPVKSTRRKQPTRTDLDKAVSQWISLTPSQRSVINSLNGITRDEIIAENIKRQKREKNAAYRARVKLAKSGKL